MPDVTRHQHRSTSDLSAELGGNLLEKRLDCFALRTARVIVTAWRSREARTDDAAAVAALLGELGYPTSEEQAALRLEGLREEPQTLVLVVKVDGAVAALGGIRSERPLDYDEP
jgi:hypothetical protein